MIVRFFVFWLVLCTKPALAADTVRVVYLGLQDDPYYAPQSSYTGLSLKDRFRPIGGAGLAMRDARIMARALGIEFVLDEQILPPEASVSEQAGAALATGAVAVLLDLPARQMEQVLAAHGTEGLFINIRDPADHWRAEGCRATLVHGIPSVAMMTDALAQYLRFRNWQRILILRGTTQIDVENALRVQASALKFGLKVADERTFVLSNDPRERTSNNISLLTGGSRYDVIWLIDDAGEFGRYVPFAMQDPRPVIGSEGLSAVAWHWTFERYGAPQLNQRFRRRVGRDMTSLDWAGWVGVRVVVAAVEKMRTAQVDALRDVILSGDLSIDLYKGPAGHFRQWDGQLRQPILLATHNAVIATAPLDGFEHRDDTLDTLGVDAVESLCQR